MKTIKIKRLPLLTIIIGGILILAGCSSPCKETGNQQLSAAFTEIQFPVVEGGEICACIISSCEKYVTIGYKSGNMFELLGKYREKLKSSGWEVEPFGSEQSISATKDKANVIVGVKECNKYVTSPGTMSNCAEITLERKK